jgi:hypothetical protein
MERDGLFENANRLTTRQSTMKRCITAFALVAVASSAQAQTRITLQGSAQDCEGAPVMMPGVRLFALDARKNQRMVATLRSMDHLDWAGDNEGSMERLLAKYDTVMNLLKRSRPMARSVSNSRGRFAFRIASVDSVLVFGYEEMEDAPVYYAYRIISGRKHRSFILDMSKGACERQGK